MASYTFVLGPASQGLNPLIFIEQKNRLTHVVGVKVVKIYLLFVVRINERLGSQLPGEKCLKFVCLFDCPSHSSIIHPLETSQLKLLLP